MKLIKDNDTSIFEIIGIIFSVLATLFILLYVISYTYTKLQGLSSTSQAKRTILINRCISHTPPVLLPTCEMFYESMSDDQIGVVWESKYTPFNRR